MGTVTYLYNPGDTVWVITNGTITIKKGDVQYIRINVRSAAGSPPVLEEILYDVILEDDAGTPDNGPTTALDVDVFGTLCDAYLELGKRLGLTGSPACPATGSP